MIKCLKITLDKDIGKGYTYTMSKSSCPKCKSLYCCLRNQKLLNNSFYLKSFLCRKCNHKWEKKIFLISEGKGYASIWFPKRRISYQLHRWVWEQKNKRKLLPYEIIHHLNDNKRDNRVFNLFLMDTSSHPKCNTHNYLVNYNRRKNE